MSTIQFMNVGHGDCAFIRHDSGRITVIDCNNCDELDEQSESEVLKALGAIATLRFDDLRKSGLREYAALEKAGYLIPLTNPAQRLKDDGVKSIFRYVQTHPELDHMRGLAIISREFSIENFWDTKNDRVLKTFSRDSDEDDWKAYQRLRAGNGPTVLKLDRKSEGAFYNKGESAGDLGDGLHILAPTVELATSANEREDWNSHSYVLALIEHGRTIIFGGDAEKGVWSDIHATYGKNLKCDVLKASHHGRESGFHENAVAAMKPGLTVVSVGKKPDTDASDEYCKHSQHVWSTRWKGDITIRIEAYGEMIASSRCGDDTLTWQVAAA